MLVYNWYIADKKTGLFLGIDGLTSDIKEAVSYAFTRNPYVKADFIKEGAFYKVRAVYKDRKFVSKDYKVVGGFDERKIYFARNTRRNIEYSKDVLKLELKWWDHENTVGALILNDEFDEIGRSGFYLQDISANMTGDRRFSKEDFKLLEKLPSREEFKRLHRGA